MSQPKSCWSCHSGHGGETFCPVCGILQPPDLNLTLFQVLGVAAGFAVNRQQLEEGYRQAQQLFHPDRFATRSATERRLSAEHVTRLNQAYQTLRDDMNRAGYILSLCGMEVGKEESAAADPQFLMAVMEAREALEEIRPGSRDALGRIDRMRRQVHEQEKQEVAALATCLHPFPAPLTGDSLQQAKRLVHRLRYHRRFLEELENLEERCLG